MPVQLPRYAERVLHLSRVDFAPAHRQPSAGSVLAATTASVAGSLGVDALLGQPARAVAVLFVMHLAIAVVTYNCLVRLARTKPAAAAPLPAGAPGSPEAPELHDEPPGRLSRF